MEERAKNIIRIILLATLLMPLLVANTKAQVVNAAADGALSIVQLNISPQPVVAGENATIVFQLYNSYSSALTNVNVQLSAANPIINVSPTGTFLISSIGQGLYGGGVGFASFVYTVHIPSTLHAGEYTIDVIANYQTSQPNSYGGTTLLPAESEIPINIYVYGTPLVKLSASTQSGLVPGQATTMTVSAVNTGTDVANNVTVILHSTREFSVFGNQQFNLGSMNPDASSQFSASVQPSINISNGTYPINATITYTAQSGKHVSVNTSINISTLINPPNIVASVVSANPTSLYTGGNQTLQIELQNIGLGTAKNITARFLNGPGIDVGSVSQFFIGSMGQKNYTEESVFVTANRSYSGSDFSLPVSLTYYSANYGSSYSNIEYLPINIQKSAVFNITSEKGSLSAGAAYKPITFTVRNIGNIEADQVTFSLQTTFPITPVNPNVYINSLAPGQVANVTFYVGVDPSGNTGSYPVTLFEQWRQPNGAVSQTFSGSDGYYAQVGNNQGGASSYTTYIEYAVVAVVVIIAAVLIMRRRRAGAQPKKKA